jgi:hypothetical protein
MSGRASERAATERSNRIYTISLPPSPGMLSSSLLLVVLFPDAFAARRLLLLDALGDDEALLQADGDTRHDDGGGWVAEDDGTRTDQLTSLGRGRANERVGS